MTLLDSQLAFRADIIVSDEAGAALSTGMAIYRDAYRGRLLAALEESFERTRRWVGAEAFTAAASHYVLTCPPRGWTLDEYGAHFPEVLGTLFAHDPEVPELAWLEWHLQKAFAAVDAPELDVAALAAAGHGEADWADMRFEPAAGFVARPVTIDCTGLWAALGDGDGAGWRAPPCPDGALLVWRTQLVPRYRVATTPELRALQTLAAGAPLATLAQGCDTQLLGEWLAQWLAEGIFSRALPGVAPGHAQG